MIFTEINRLANWWKVPTLSPNLKKLYLQTSKGCMNIFPIFLYSFIPPLEKGGTLSIWVCKSAFSFPLAVISAKQKQNRSLQKVRKICCRGGATKACAPNIRSYINGRAARTKILSHGHSVSALPLQDLGHRLPPDLLHFPQYSICKSFMTHRKEKNPALPSKRNSCIRIGTNYT